MRYFKIAIVATGMTVAILAVSASLFVAHSSTIDAHILFFPNDFGSDSIDVSQYPIRMQRYYKLFLAKCSICHTVARPLNAQFLELTNAEMQRAMEGQPHLFRAGTDVVKPSPNAWNKILHRMMSKPGASISQGDGIKIWAFLVYDSKVRKMGSNLGPWESWRRNLLSHFKGLYPQMYQRLLKRGELKNEDTSPAFVIPEAKSASSPSPQGNGGHR